MAQSIRQQGLFFYLYFFEGAPIGLLWWTLPTLLADQGQNVEVITRLAAFATLPWAFKFLLGPFVDRFVVKERSYAWTIAILQMGLLMSLVLFLRAGLQSPYLWGLVFGISFFSAIQDVVIDAWAMARVAEQDRGRVNGAMQAGMLSGRWAFGAGLLVLIQWFPWEKSVFLLSALLIASIVFLISAFQKNLQEIGPKIESLNYQRLAFIFEKKFISLAMIALLSGFALKSLGTVIGPFLLASAFTQPQVGLILSITLLLMLLGSLSGGFLSDLKRADRVFLFSGLILAISVPLTGFAANLLSQGLVLIGVVVTYFIIGHFVASSYTFYMNQSSGVMEASKFTYLMAMTNLCESGSAYVTGAMAQHFGYFMAFILTAIVSGLGLYKLYSLSDGSIFKEPNRLY